MNNNTLANLQYLKNQHMWSNEDIQKTIDFLNENPDSMELFKTEVTKCYTKFTDYCNDRAAILNSLEIGDVDAFYSYDSAVLENYIDFFEKIILKGEHY